MRHPIGDQEVEGSTMLLFLASHKVGFFRISLFIPNGICSLFK